MLQLALTATHHCSTIARLAVGVFCFASPYFAFLPKHLLWVNNKTPAAAPAF